MARTMERFGGGEAISDPCSLLAQSDVAAALGEEIQEPVAVYSSTANIGLTDAQATVGTCNYITPSGSELDQSYRLVGAG